MPLTADEFRSHVTRISELSGDNEEVMNELRVLTDDLTERESRPTFSESEVYDADGVAWSEKYNQLKTQYRERFFAPPAESDPPPKQEEREEKSINDLFV